MSHMWVIYNTLERIAETAGILKVIEDIKRADDIKQDIMGNILQDKLRERIGVEKVVVSQSFLDKP